MAIDESIPFDYWERRKVYHDYCMKIASGTMDELVCKRVNPQLWALLEEELHAHKLSNELCREVSVRFPDPRTVDSFGHLVVDTTSAFDLQKKPESELDEIYEKFSKPLVDQSKVRHPRDPTKLWCPILHNWFPGSSMTPVDIFPRYLQQPAMDAVFGKREKDNLCSPRNGILMSTAAYEKFDQGLIIIVPSLELESCQKKSPCQPLFLAWKTCEEKPYKIRITNRSACELRERLPQVCGNKTWLHLDNVELQFQSKFRPEPRYLYFRYCVAMLRFGYHQKLPPVLYKEKEDEVTGRCPYWMLPDSYIKGTLLSTMIGLIKDGSGDLWMGADMSADNPKIHAFHEVKGDVDHRAALLICNAVIAHSATFWRGEYMKELGLLK